MSVVWNAHEITSNYEDVVSVGVILHSVEEFWVVGSVIQTVYDYNRLFTKSL